MGSRVETEVVWSSWDRGRSYQFLIPCNPAAFALAWP